MYNGSNPTALQSQKWLVNTLHKLFQSTEYSKITIKDLCKKADLTRQTFYQYFDSKNDVMRYCIREKFIDTSHILESATMEDLMTLLKVDIAKNRDFIKLLYNNHLSSLFAEEISDLLASIADKTNPNRNSKTSPIANAFLMSAIANSLLVWSQESDITEDEYVDLLYQILAGNYYTLDEKSQNN
jgi:AcrR family transcriptional regulator